MRSVTLDDVAGLARYAEMRDEFRNRIIALKRSRRIAVGDKVSFVFENFDTVLFQIQEMLHAERIVDLDRVREEIAVYNELLPRDGELSATMLIEITEQSRIPAELQRLIGIDETVSIAINGKRSRGEFEPGRSREDKLSAVQYVRFPLEPSARDALRSGTAKVELMIDHPNYRASTELSRDQVASLAQDVDRLPG
jgi:hypothetical protein